MIVEIIDFVYPAAFIGGVLLLLTWAKKAIQKQIVTIKTEAFLQSLGIKSVNADFINKLTKEGVQNILNLYLGKLQIEKSINPLSAISGLPKSVQEIFALTQMGQVGGQQNEPK